MLRAALASLLCFLLVSVLPARAQVLAMRNTSVPGAAGYAPAPEGPPPEATPADSPGTERDTLLRYFNASPAGSFSAEVDYLLRWFKPVCLSVPVVTAGNPADKVPGALGQPGTQILVGGVPPHKFEFGATSGGEIILGWVRPDRAFGVEVNGFLMETASAAQRFVASPGGSPTYLAYTAPDNSHQALPFTIPGVVTGSSVAIGSTHLWGAEANARFPFMTDRPGGTVFGAFLLGGRYLDLTDRVRIDNALKLVADPSAFAVGADQVITRNQFYGPQIGGSLGTGGEWWSLEGTLKLAAGLTHQSRIIEGAPVLAASVASPLLVPGPLVALPSNTSRETADRVTLVPEVGIKSRLALASWCFVTLGYRLIYWNKVLCPSDQMDPLVNVSQLPFHGPVNGPALPAPVFMHTDYFTQGLELGLQFQF